MASARKNRPSAKPSRPPDAPSQPAPSNEHWIVRAFDSIYRFLASVKLAVICIATLAMVLAGATFFESSYGVAAVRQYVYQHPAFAILLAFLGTNIFCAATIRFPWKKRQIGFLITHIGLLIILGGAFVSLRFSDEGQLGMPEGTASNELVRIDHNVVRVQKFDRSSRSWGDTYKLPFTSGAFSWHSDDVAKLAKTGRYQTQVWLTRIAFGVSLAALAGFLYVWVIVRPASLGVFMGSFAASVLIAVTAGTGVFVALTPSSARREVITDSSDPFTFVVEDYLASSGLAETRAEPAPDGDPAVKVSLLVKPPGQTETKDFLEGNNWMEASNGTFYRRARPGVPAAVVYQFAKKDIAANLVDDFLHPPKSPITDSAARIHYLDRNKARRVYEWILNDSQKGKSVTLPDSDLTMMFEGVDEKSLQNTPAANLHGAIGEDHLHIARFEAKLGKETFSLGAIGSLPAFPQSAGEMPAGLLGISYYHPPELTARGAGMGGKLAQVEILQVEGGPVYVRAFGRSGLMGEPSQVALGRPLPLIANVNMPMQIAIRVDAAEEKVRIRNVYLPYERAREDRDNAIPAIQAEMTVKGVTQPVSLLRANSILPDSVRWQTLAFEDAVYRVCFDFDRRPFPDFSLSLVKFEPGRDPGAENAASYRSDVKLSDSALGFKNEERTISMNYPLTHRGWSFYQTSFFKVTDPETGVEDGAYASVFQVHYDPAWHTIYLGCLVTVMGIFVQFYMRAGLFSDGGKRERERAQAKLEKLVSHANGTNGTTKPRPTPAKADQSIEDL